MDQGTDLPPVEEKEIQNSKSDFLDLELLDQLFLHQAGLPASPLSMSFVLCNFKALLCAQMC